MNDVDVGLKSLTVLTIAAKGLLLPDDYTANGLLAAAAEEAA